MTFSETKAIYRKGEYTVSVLDFILMKIEQSIQLKDLKSKYPDQPLNISPRPSNINEVNIQGFINKIKVFLALTICLDKLFVCPLKKNGDKVIAPF